VNKDSCLLVIPAGSTNLYKKATGWSTFLRMEEPTGWGHQAKSPKSLQVIGHGGLIQVTGAGIGDRISVFSLMGVFITSSEVVLETTKIRLPSQQPVLLRTKFHSMVYIP
jgi:hypothetical protein